MGRKSYLQSSNLLYGRLIKQCTNIPLPRYTTYPFLPADD
jgi:hypothetical protein